MTDFEDAIHHYAIPTVVFDFHLLVLDTDQAADCLVTAGCTVETEPSRIGIADVDLPQQRLLSPDDHTKIVLLLASDWKFPLMPDSPLELVPLNDEFPDRKLAFPPLPGLLDAIIESWLDGPPDSHTSLAHLAVQYCYLYEYVPTLKQKSFGAQLKYEHRQFHNDALAGIAVGTIYFRNHEREIRDALLQGRYELRDCSASRDNDQPFDVWAKLRGRLPKLPQDECGARKKTVNKARQVIMKHNIDIYINMAL
ncbi:hypothetical protein BDW59DRAFT_160263 [Aspergillus cavernicola]|uniref:Uncharacterized protein n=1 Tax=Aspergillus cavernicola TaxID=176166 RepID=A0ABR4IIN1_9EURO